MFWTSLAVAASTFAILNALVGQHRQRSTPPGGDSEGEKIEPPSGGVKSRAIASAVVIPVGVLIDCAYLPGADIRLRTAVQIGVVAVFGLAASFAWFGVIISRIPQQPELGHTPDSAEGANGVDERDELRTTIALAVVMSVLCLGLAAYFWVFE